MDLSNLFNLLIAIPAFVAALTVHEFAHAWAGTRLGDDLAKREGRLTLDPLKHLDPIGSLVFAIGALSPFGALIGWAKPVPFNPRNFNNPRRDAMFVALAGPISNILQVPVWLFLTWLASRLLPGDAARVALSMMGMDAYDGNRFAPGPLIIQILMMGVTVNLTIAAFNMIPLPPLDGHWVLEYLGPESVSRFYDSIRPFSFIILLVLINLPAPFNILRTVIGPIYQFGRQLVLWAMTQQWFPPGY